MGAIISAGCLMKDASEYQERFNASPEGIARIQELKRLYGRHSFDEWMRQFGCTYRQRPPLNPDLQYESLCEERLPHVQEHALLAARWRAAARVLLCLSLA